MPHAKTIYTLIREPSADAYQRLVDYAARRGGLFTLVLREDAELSLVGQALLGKLAPALISQERTSRWPGTELHGHCADLLVYRLESQTAHVLKTAAHRLYEWLHPDLPEDLAFLDDQREAWLVSIAHEEDAYVTLPDWEVQSLLHFVPELKGSLRKDADSIS